MIFDHPWGLLTIAVIGLLVVWVFRAVLQDKRRWWQWLVPVLVALAAFGFDRLVETDLEKIKAVISTGVKAVEEENCDAIEAIVSQDYRDSFHHSKESLMRSCRSRLAEPLVKKNIKRIVSIEIVEPATTATAVFTVRIIFDERSYVHKFKPIMMTKVEAELHKTLDNKWLINRLEVLSIDMQPARWKDITEMERL